MAFVYTDALLATTMRPFCPQFEIFRLEKNAMPTLEWYSTLLTILFI